MSDLTEWYPPACNTMMFKLWNTGILASYLWKKNGYGVMSRRQHPIFKIILTKNIHLGVATRSSTKLDCLKPIRFHQYTWGLQHFLTFLQEDIGHIKCYWFNINYLFLSSFYIGNITFQIFDRNYIPSCTSAGSVLQLCKVSFNSNEPFRRSCAYKPISPYRMYFRV